MYIKLQFSDVLTQPPVLQFRFDDSASSSTPSWDLALRGSSVLTGLEVQTSINESTQFRILQRGYHAFFVIDLLVDW